MKAPAACLYICSFAAQRQTPSTAVAFVLGGFTTGTFHNTIQRFKTRATVQRIKTRTSASAHQLESSRAFAASR